ncbi:MAG: CCA tRNA nucleotidyltransferase [Sediminimonas qiaohouensis]|uniref:CCA tRNA nucleotidyltransferase n=1 Tax=Sediminimonas qiaohouensis TaxID=552061 RepID=A0A7C9LS22_9RHOB|nr:CCA tRNA nucleotidyltransferase [Sediminimonas qiaohouensis]MTJ04696.1 CCA tRNA nucleotidyltransferase [Sediminimonas qiaohouensis]
MRLEAEWIGRTETQRVCAVLTDVGYQAWFVGGCVRNTLLGQPVADIDITTDARPEKVLGLAESASLRAVATGMDHGTVTLICNGVPHEVTTMRRDVETDGRHAVIAYADTIEEDAHRRDFTMNAIYAAPDGWVHDPLGGLVDLKARRVRFIDDPDQRISEDFLRILRFFRFHAWYGDPATGPDPDALASIANHVEGLETLSRERIGGEMRKLLSAPDPAPAIATMRSLGVLAHVLPGAEDSALAPLVHLEAETGCAPDAMRRLAAIGGDDPKTTLRLSRAQERTFNQLREAVGDPDSAAALGYRHGADRARDILLLRAAILKTPFDPNSLTEVEEGAAARFPVRAADLMPEVNGVELGRKLKELERRWIDSGFRLSREDLIG